jgi:hypothetical protein
LTDTPPVALPLVVHGLVVLPPERLPPAERTPAQEYEVPLLFASATAVARVAVRKASAPGMLTAGWAVTAPFEPVPLLLTEVVGSRYETELPPRATFSGWADAAEL